MESTRIRRNNAPQTLHGTDPLVRGRSDCFRSATLLEEDEDFDTAQTSLISASPHLTPRCTTPEIPPCCLTKEDRDGEDRHHPLLNQCADEVGKWEGSGKVYRELEETLWLGLIECHHIHALATRTNVSIELFSSIR